MASYFGAGILTVTLAACGLGSMHLSKKESAQESQWTYLTDTTASLCHKALSASGLDSTDWQRIVETASSMRPGYITYRIIELTGFINSIFQNYQGDNSTMQYKKLWEEIQSQQRIEYTSLEKKYIGKYQSDVYKGEVAVLQKKHLVDIYVFMSQDQHLYKLLTSFCHPVQMT